MQRLQAFKYEIRPNGEQARDMRRFAGSCRFVFNKALALQKARYEQGEKKLGYAGLCKELTAWRNGVETLWLANAPVHPLQQALKDLERAYANFFEKRADFPRFKKKGQRDSFRYPDPKQIKLDQGNARIFLPKLGWLRYRNSREVLGEFRNATVSLSGGKWFVSIQTEREIEPPMPEAVRAIGIDVGIARFATMSDGTFLTPLNSFKKHEARLRRYQPAKRSSATTGRRPKPKSSAFTPASAMPAATTCTRPRPLSAKTTRWCVSKTYRYGICPSRRQAAPISRGKMFGPSPA
jgi:putative transposase